jgi:flagellar biosynthesis protein
VNEPSIDLTDENSSKQPPESSSIPNNERAPVKEAKKMAVALGGTGGVASNIPKILASGRGDMAQKLLDWADEQGLIIEKNSDLAQVLTSLNLGDSVPEEVFMAVAEILYYVYEVNDEIKNAAR